MNIRGLICKFKGHMFLEWSHDNEIPRHMFIRGTVMLKKPWCIRCLADKKEKVEEKVPPITIGSVFKITNPEFVDYILRKIGDNKA